MFVNNKLFLFFNLQIKNEKMITVVYTMNVNETGYMNKLFL